MKWIEYYNALLENRLITPIWKEVLSLLDLEIGTNDKKDDYLILTSILFSLINDGNLCMSLSKDELTRKWTYKLSQTKILLEDLGTLNVDEYVKTVYQSNLVIDRSLGDFDEQQLPSLFGKNKFFDIDEGRV